MPAHLVSMIDVRDFGSETVRIGDLNADGAPDLLFVQCVYPTREITCLTATSILGDVLWQVGAPSPENGRLYSDLPVQIYDWDGDGQCEVLYVKQAVYAEPLPGGSWAREGAKRYEGEATMIVLDAATGREKGRFALPAPADDCFLFADLTGRGRPQDLVVKDRYWNMWGVSHAGEVLWHWPGSPGHFPAVADVDGDGRDEVFVGLALVDHDGKELFRSDVETHQDAVYIWRLDEDAWLLLTVDDGVRCLEADGTELWRRPLKHAQHVVAGRFRTDSPVQFAVIDRTQPDVLLLYDLEGKELWRRPQPGAKDGCCAGCVGIEWSGPGRPKSILVYGRGRGEPVAVYDGSGEIVDTCAMAYTPERKSEERRAEFYCTMADVWGDSREEVIMFGSRGACIYANARPLEVPSLFNETLYPGL